LRYIDEIKVVSSNIALEKGTYIHLVLENYKYLKNTNFSKYPEFNFELSNKDDIDNYHQIINNFINSKLGHYYLEDIEVIGEELEFGLDLKLLPIDYDNPNTILRGKIDKIIKKNNEYIIVDWKTGKVPDQLYHDNSQGILYALWFFRQFKDINEVKMSFVYIEHNQEYKHIFKREYLQNYAKMFSNKIIAIEKCENFTKNETKLCEYCDYRKQNFCYTDK